MPRQLLDDLIGHASERFDRAALADHLGLQRYTTGSRMVAALAADLPSQGIARPWNEAHASYLPPAGETANFTCARAVLASVFE